MKENTKLTQLNFVAHFMFEEYFKIFDYYLQRHFVYVVNYLLISLFDPGPISGEYINSI